MRHAANLFHAGVRWSRIFDMIAGLLVRSSFRFLSCLQDDVILVFGGWDPFIMDILVLGGTWDNTCKITVHLHLPFLLHVLLLHNYLF